MVYANGVEMRQVPGFERYAVNRLGLVYDFETEWFVLSDLTADGYAVVRLRRDDGVWGRVYCHEFSARAWMLNPKRRRGVAHKSLTITDNGWENLQWVKGGAKTMDSGERNRGIVCGEVKKKMSDAKIGARNPRFIGYYVTEIGAFDSLERAAELHGVNKSTMKRRFDRGYPGYSIQLQEKSGK